MRKPGKTLLPLLAGAMLLAGCEALTAKRVAAIVEEPEKLDEFLDKRRIASSEEVRDGLDDPGALQHLVNHIKKYNAKPLTIREYRWKSPEGGDIKSFYVENKDRKMFAKFDFDVSDRDRIILDKIALYPDVIE